MYLSEFRYDIDDIITTDGYLSFCLKNNLCYIKTDFFYLGKFIWRGVEHPNRIDNICVVGHSDYPIVDSISKRFDKIFCINRNTDMSNTYGLPIGITNDSDESPLHPIYGNKKIMVDIYNDDSIKKTNLLYMNFNINNYPLERNFVWDLFLKENYTKIGVIENSLNGRAKFLQEIKSSKFVLCPRGNGIDTHRIWESLYMGSIPIVRCERAHHLFKDLPILFINDWNEINKYFLEKKYNEMMKINFNLEKLKISYWEKFIIDNV